MKRILVPVDFSPQSENACRYVAALSEDLAMRVELFHAHYDPILDSDLPDYGFSEEEKPSAGELLVEKARRDLETMRQRLKEYFEPDTPLEVTVVQGPPEKEILAEAERTKADFVVMGKRGKGNALQAIFGSVTTRVTELAPTPVLAIPVDARYSGIRNVLYASDFDDFDGKAIAELVASLRPLVVQVHCVHLFDSVDRQLVGEDLASLQEKLEEHVGEVGNIRFEVLQGSRIIEVLEAYIQQHQIDLLAMTTHHRGFLTRMFEPSVVRRMLFHTHTPLLVFHSDFPRLSQLVE